jgi:hypothetical protein
MGERMEVATVSGVIARTLASPDEVILLRRVVHNGHAAIAVRFTNYESDTSSEAYFTPEMLTDAVAPDTVLAGVLQEMADRVNGWK